MDPVDRAVCDETQKQIKRRMRLKAETGRERGLREKEIKTNERPLKEIADPEEPLSFTSFALINSWKREINFK